MTSREERPAPVVTADHTEQAVSDKLIWQLTNIVTSRWREEPYRSGRIVDPDGLMVEMRATLHPLVAALAAAEQRAKDAEESARIRGVHLDQWERAYADQKARAVALARLIGRFLQWDALTDIPDPVPAPFGDIHYWVAEFRRALAGEEGADE